MNYLSELQRRNVFKVAIAYLMLAWLILQFVDVITPILNLPDWFSKVVLVLLIIVFPITILMTWAFELTPEGIKKTKDIDVEQSILKSTGQKINYLIIGFLTLVIGFQFWNKSPSDIKSFEISENSIAVLPFANMSGNDNDQYFSDGLSEELLTVLSKIPELKVSGRTSSFSFRGQNQNLKVIGETLGVNHILEGSVRKQGDRVRISVQLIRTLDGFNVWSETFDRLLKDIFVVQEDIANAISNNLEIELDLATTPTLISARTENMKVYDLYLESKMLMSRRGAENLNKALLLLNDATKLEPDYAAAWGLLAQAHTLAYYYHEIESTLVGMYLGEEAARRALEIDPASSLAHGALGDILKDKYHWEGAEEQYLLALKYDPENTEARSQYSQLLARTGRFSDALPYTEKSVVLDPLGTIYNLTSGVILHNLNRIDEGLYYFDKSIEIAGDTSFFPYGIRLVAGIKEDDKELTQDFLKHLLIHNKVTEARFFNSNLVEAISDPDILNDYLVNVDNYFEDNPQELNSDNIFAGIVYAAMAAKVENYELALKFLEREAELNIENINHDALSNHWAPVFGPIQNNLRFKQIRTRYGMPSFWRTNGWPDYCLPISDQDFECKKE